MVIMGSSCSLNKHKKKNLSRNTIEKHEQHKPEAVSCRHSVDKELPDQSIAALYPVEDNYVMDDDGKSRSPKSLAQLCIHSICRNLTDFDQDIPSGLPQELVNEILKSLVLHAALNASTLKALKNCELVELPLQGCRGVSDDWLQGFSSVGGDESISNCSSSSYHSAVSRTWNLDSVLPAESNSIVDINESEGTHIETFDKTASTFSQTTLLDLRDSQKLTDKGLLHLKNLKHLEKVRLDNCHSIRGRGLIAFSNSLQIHTMTMSNCRSLTDEAITNIGHLTMLTSLSLDGCRCLSDISLRSIGSLLNLRKLDLSQCDLLTDNALQFLERIFFLEELSLGWCRRISDKGIEILVDQPGRNEHLRTLSLARCQISDAGVRSLAKTQGLENLNLNGCCNIKSTALGETLSMLKRLETLDVSYCPSILRSSWQGRINSLRALDLCYSAVNDMQLSWFTNLPSLQEINFDSCPIGDWSIAHLADNNVVPNLLSLNLADCDITDLGMVHLPKFETLKHLSLFYCNISNHGLRHLSRMMSLETLNLDSRDISDDGLYHLRGLSLKSLDIFSGRITDIGCVHVGRIKTLESLELCGGNVSDAGCLQIANNLNRLTSLNLGHNELITNNGASTLAGLSNLKALNLSYTRVNAEALRSFGKLRRLQSLAMYGCHGVPDSIRTSNLHCELPNLKCLRVNGCMDDDGRLLRSNSSSNDMFVDGMSSGDESENEDLLSHADVSDAGDNAVDDTNSIDQGNRGTSLS